MQSAIRSATILVALACLLGADAAKSPRLVRLELRAAETEPGPALDEAVVAGTDRKIYLHRKAALTNADIAAARVERNETSAEPQIAIDFTPDGARKMAALTTRQLGKPVAIVVEGRVVSAPIVRSTISRQAVITGRLTLAEAERIAAGIVGR